MLQSIIQLYNAPFNRIHPVFAFRRWCLWKFIRLFRIKNYTYRLWNHKKINLHYDNQQSAWLMYNYWVDWEEFNLIKDVVKKNDVVFDIGSNIGFYTIWMSHFIGSSGRIHAFEPDKKSHERLSNNIDLNQLNTKVIANRVAIADEVKRVKFTEEQDGRNHIINNGKDCNVAHQILSCTTIDKYVTDNTINKIKYMKIDIEGFEYQALLGASNTLKKKKIDILQLEINSQIQNSSVSVDEIVCFIENMGYELCSYNLASKKFIPIKYNNTRENYFMVNHDLI
jgi:FkbM family methyltransferase